MTPAGELIQVLVVDDHPIVRAGLSSIVTSQPDMEVIGQAGTGEEALKVFARQRPDLTLMDLKLPDLSGVDVIRRLRQRFGDVKILVLTTYEGDEDIYQALQAGAVGYIVKGMQYELLLQGIRRIHSGKNYLPAEISKTVEARSPDELSVREREVLTLMAKGNSNQAIAMQLGITEGTVKCHVGVILSYLGAKDRTQAVLLALQRGFVRL